ncbi:MAG: hypothetical protein HY302_12970 [Opitutae bacterium]|nr:hypothetical protein [Opitutae bacterium]
MQLTLEANNPGRPQSPMRVDLYKVVMPSSFNLTKCVDRVFSKDLRYRNRQHGDDQMRLEALKKEGDLWYLDFVRIRMTQGPAKTPLRAPSTGFSLEPDEGFGEETAMLWNTATDWCVMQYNHHSLRPNSIAEYFTNYDAPSDYVVRFLPKIDPQILAKLRSKKIVTHFSIEVAPSEISNNDYDEGMSLISAAKNFEQHGADVVTIKLATRHGRGRSLNIDLEKIRDWISSVFAKEKRDAVLAASASIKRVPNERAEPIDLLAHQISKTVHVEPGTDRRLPREVRWRELFLLHELWARFMM